MLAILILGLCAGCEGTPGPGTSPIRVQATLDEVPNAFGYFAFSVQKGESISGTITVSETLVAGDGAILATRTYSQSVRVGEDRAFADAMLESHFSPPWPVTLTENAEERACAKLQFERAGVGPVEVAGVWYANLETPTEAGPDGLYFTRVVGVYRTFLPMVFR